MSNQLDPDLTWKQYIFNPVTSTFEVNKNVGRPQDMQSNPAWIPCSDAEPEILGGANRRDQIDYEGAD